MSFSADVITLFPDLFPGPLGASVLGRGMGEGLWSLRAHQLRDFATDRHRTVDDTPSGGGAGMVLKPDILARAIDDIAPDSTRPRILMSPRGTPLTQARAHELATGPGAVIICDNSIASAHRYKDLQAYMRAEGSGYTNMTLPFSKGLEMSVWTGTGTAK